MFSKDKTYLIVMDSKRLKLLLNEYKNAPEVFRATSYWKPYEKEVIKKISSIDERNLRSGEHEVLKTFGFRDIVWQKTSKGKFLHKFFGYIKKILGKYAGLRTSAIPYNMSLRDIREMAYRHCRLYGDICGAKPIKELCMSDFGNPTDVFEVEGKTYSMQFLSYYVRYCFYEKNSSIDEDNIIVNLGPGCGYQVEIIKKLYPESTILCFDLPAQIFLCETYLDRALKNDSVVKTDKTIGYKNLDDIENGKVYCFPSWKFPLLEGLDIDIFWNAASFGEMEPDIVDNYLSYIRGNSKNVYLMQAKSGKETEGEVHVEDPILFEDYVDMLGGFELIGKRDAWQAHRRLSQSGGYFEAVWEKE